MTVQNVVTCCCILVFFVCCARVVNKDIPEGDVIPNLLHVITVSIPEEGAESYVEENLNLIDGFDPRQQAVGFCKRHNIAEESCVGLVEVAVDTYSTWSDQKKHGEDVSLHHDHSLKVDSTTLTSRRESSTCPYDITPSPTLTVVNDAVKPVSSQEGFEPTFTCGSAIETEGVVAKWLNDEIPYFNLVKDFLMRLPQPSGIALDLGANRGFYTYFLASLGLNVHAFEIQPMIFKILQHGQLFNRLDLAKSVKLYKMGLSHTHDAMRFSNADGIAFLAPVKLGEMATVSVTTLDCFLAQHSDELKFRTKGKINDEVNDGVNHVNYTYDNVAPKLVVDFLKIDIEGYEVSALLGGIDFFAEVEVKSMLIEIGPSRFARSNITTEIGVFVFEYLSEHYFSTVYIILKDDMHCPLTLQYSLMAEGELAGHSVKIVDTLHLYPVSLSSWSTLINVMYENDNDCNFWFEI